MKGGKHHKIEVQWLWLWLGRKMLLEKEGGSLVVLNTPGMQK